MTHIRLLLASLALSACTAPPGLALVAMTPDHGASTAATSVVIEGARFYLGVDERFDAPASRLDRSFSARLGDDVLTEPTALTANGVDTVEIVARVTDDAGQGVPGEPVTFSASAGTLGPPKDSGDGTYRVQLTAPASAGSGQLTVTATDAAASLAPSDSVDLVLRSLCTGADAIATSWSTLVSAVTAANAASTHFEICIPADTTIAMSAPLDVTAPAGVTLRGEARAKLTGSALGSSSFGLSLHSNGSVVRDLELTSFAGTVIDVGGANVHIERNRFDHCGRAVRILGDDAFVGPDNDIAGSSPGVSVEGSRALVVGNLFHDHASGPAVVIGASGVPADTVVRQNLFIRDEGGVQIEESAGARIDGNTFAFLTDDAVSLGDDVSAVLARNNIFAYLEASAIVASSLGLQSPPSYNDFFEVAAECASCTLGPGNLAVDPLFVAAELDDFHLSLTPPSPCVDAGVDVGDPFLGAAPDLGAIEAR